ncbi:phage portal protein [Nonomuraea sp. NPDC050404]|uniref:phage portal protein n=1 Tax=Nonomuraea sp. NPDC050404 TaxID=3155783 RepID=UPI0033DEB93B
MPLPTHDQEWPPPHMRAEMRLYAQHGAWYSGDPDRLAEVYGNGAVTPGLGLDLKGWDRPLQWAGGAVGRVARWFWGSPIPAGQSRSTKLHVPLAADIAAKSADLLFSEPPTLRAAGKKTQKRIDQIMNEGSVYAGLLEAGELDSAYGGVYLRVGWDTEMVDHPVVDSLPADSAVPEFHSGRLHAVTFWRVVGEDQKVVWRHLERHEKGRVFHGLYQGDDSRLGHMVPLEDHPATAGFAAIVDADGGFDSGYQKGLLVHYVPNMRPHRTLRGTALGRSDYAGVEPLMDALDETWTSWMRDLRLGKARIIVPEVYLQNTGRGKGSYWDPDREIYSGLGMLPPANGGGNMITESQFKIRVEEHQQTAKGLVAQILRGAGYSVQSFGEAGEGVEATATEIHSRERQSLTTRGRKVGYWTPALAWLGECLLHVDHYIYKSKVTAERPQVEWPDGVFLETESVARTVDLLNRAQSASIDTRIRMVHPDWDDEQVTAEMKRLRDELGLNVRDADTFDEQILPGLDDDLDG